MEFVNFELAKSLKEKGYPQRTFGEYDMQGACYIEDGRFYENGCMTEVARAYTAPTISQVLKWLREEKKLHISIEYGYAEIPLWDFEIRLIGNYGRWWTDEIYSSYELAAIAGIEYVLDNLI